MLRGSVSSQSPACLVGRETPGCTPYFKANCVDEALIGSARCMVWGCVGNQSACASDSHTLGVLPVALTGVDPIAAYIALGRTRLVMPSSLLL